MRKKADKKKTEEKEPIQDEAAVEVDSTIEENEVEAKEIDSLYEELEELKAQLAESKDKYLRLFAEFENYKKRMIREKVDVRRLASIDTITKLLPVLDDFERAKAVAEDETTEEVFTDGVRLVYEKLKKALKDSGLRKMDTEGGKFDPELHDAFAELPVDKKKKKGMILDTIEAGYYLNDKIIRHAKVVVGK